MHDFPYFLGAALSSSLLAVGLERWGREHYEPDGTIGLVYVGVAMTGGWVALRLAFAPLPALAGAEMAWWTWWLVFWMFWATGLPITAWQFWQARQRLAAAIDYLRERRHADASDDGAALAEGPGGDPETHD